MAHWHPYTIHIFIYDEHKQGAKRSYHENIVDHYENPRNVGSLDKNDPNVGTVIFLSLRVIYMSLLHDTWPWYLLGFLLISTN